MTEQLKNDILRKLYEKLPTEALREVSTAIDLSLARYDVTMKEMHLALPSAEGHELVKTYVASKAVEGLSINGLNNTRYALDAFFDAVMMPPERVKTNDIRLYLFTYKQTRGVSDRSMDKIRQRINSFFQWALEEGYIEKNPCGQIKRIKHEEKPRRALSQIELERMRAACKNDRERMVLELLYSTGCRASEIVGIRVADINRQTNEVLVLGKGKKYRTVYLNAKAQMAISVYLENRKQCSEYLICATRSPYGPVNYSSIEKIIRKIAKRAGFENGEVTPHILRHTFATTMLQNGGKVQSVQKALGHSNISTTMIYAEVDNRQVREEIRRTVI
ncbi:MAG: tyrosine-type recombinase/integrase [Oscillospiraceae bacterium]|nr:tyrosine-type recombinase/integrase [Oscillospiraceae bacterium]